MYGSWKIKHIWLFRFVKFVQIARVRQEKGVPLLDPKICFPEFSMRKIMNSWNCLLVIVCTVQTERVYTVRKYWKDYELFCLSMIFSVLILTAFIAKNKE